MDACEEFGAARVAGDDRRDERAMLRDGLGAAVAAEAAARAQRFGEAAPHRHRAVGDRVGGHAVEDGVEVPVGGENCVVVAGLRRALVRDHRGAQGLALGRGGARRGGRGHHAAQRLAHFIDVADEGLVDRDDGRAAMRLRIEQPFALELAQRLAHRHLAHRIADREVADLDPRTRGEHAVENVAADRLHDPVADRGRRQVGRGFRGD